MGWYWSGDLQLQLARVWLGAFGAAHGVNELLGLLTLGLGSDNAFALARLFLTTASFWWNLGGLSPLPFEAAVRGSDGACCYGGEEFVLIMPEVSLEAVKARGEEIRENVPQLQLLHCGQLLESITVFLGVAMVPDHGAMREDALRAADEAVYQTKRAGRNRVVVAVGGV